MLTTTTRWMKVITEHPGQKLLMNRKSGYNTIIRSYSSDTIAPDLIQECN